MAGEDLDLAKLEKLDMGEDFKFAISRVYDGGNVYIVGPPASGKTVMLRKIGLYMARLGREGIYVKLGWFKYGWGLKDYLERYGEKSEFLTSMRLGTGLILLDDGELIWRYPTAYSNFLVEIRGAQIVASFREIDVDMATALFGDGFIIYLQRQYGEPRPKIPLGFNFIGSSREIVVI